jgi:hypothetical protein
VRAGSSAPGLGTSLCSKRRSSRPLQAIERSNEGESGSGGSSLQDDLAGSKRKSGRSPCSSLPL